MQRPDFAAVIVHLLVAGSGRTERGGLAQQRHAHLEHLV